MMRVMWWSNGFVVGGFDGVAVMVVMKGMAMVMWCDYGNVMVLL